MQQSEGDFNHIEYKKPYYPLCKELIEHLTEYSRFVKIPIGYDDLLRYQDLVPIKDENDVPTLWNSVSYPPGEIEEILHSLVSLYQMLNADGSPIDYLRVGSIDFCSYGNSKPFRIKIVNDINDNHDYFYVKRTDASRVYGLELEQIFSPNKMNYLLDEKTIVEEHIIGIPGDDFIKMNSDNKLVNRVRLAKEFVKFNERCFVRLLGDMRAYNFVIRITQDFDNVQYRIRAMDFDQQNFEGRKNLYLPQFFKDNLELVLLSQEVMSIETAEQYMNEERSSMRKRLLASLYEAKSLLRVIRKDDLSTVDNIDSLKKELAKYYQNDAFLNCKTMGDILILNIENRLGVTIF